MGESVAFPYLACLILRTASGCDIVAVKFPGACPGFPDLKPLLPSSSLNLVKSKPCIFFNTPSMASLISALLTLPMSCDCTKFRSLAMALAASVAFFPIQLSRYSSPERETRFASMCRWACSFLLSVPLCR